MRIGQAFFNGIAFGAWLSLMASGLALIFGILRVVNFAHGVLFMLGAYAAYYVAGATGSYWLGVLVAMAGLALGSLLLERVIFRRFDHLLLEGAVAAIALALLIQNLSWAAFGGQPRNLATPLEGAFDVAGITMSRHRTAIIGLSLLVMLALALLVKRTRLGRAMRAVQQDRYAAQLQGVNTARVSMASFAIGGGLAGLAGGLVAPIQVLLPNMGEFALLLAFVVIILGGMGSITGAFVAAYALGLVYSFTATYSTSQTAIWVSFLLAMVVLTFRPTGLFGHD